MSAGNVKCDVQHEQPCMGIHVLSMRKQPVHSVQACSHGIAQQHERQPAPARPTSRCSTHAAGGGFAQRGAARPAPAF
eukprot:1191619-Alexandrium_andersonii.AAC.1